ncbi:hypothetical protein OH492_19140 [Vibrio chagasii]|nr:hypothetical protein [Vibrio chagasii]
MCAGWWHSRRQLGNNGFIVGFCGSGVLTSRPYGTNAVRSEDGKLAMSTMMHWRCNWFQQPTNYRP